MNRSLLWISLAAFSVPAFGLIPTVVVPNANASLAGNDSSGPLTGPFSLEFQADLGAVQFASLPSSVYFTGLSYRAKPGTGALSITITGTLFLSTSPTFPNSTFGPLQSTTFANNHGADYTQVWTGTFTMNAPACAGPAPWPFGNTLVFDTPFQFHQGATNPLLVDLKLTTFTGSGQFDVQSYSAPGGFISDVFATPLGASTGSFEYSSNVVQLTYTTIPATPVPPSILLTLAGLACVGIYMGRRGLKFA